jgi:hypothetical protein
MSGVGQNRVEAVNGKHVRRKQFVRGRANPLTDSRPIGFKRFDPPELRTPNQNACQENQRAAQSHLEQG